MSKAYIAVGTNIGERNNNIQIAVKSLDTLIGTKVLKLSGIYETAPVGYSDQPNFLNAAVLVETSLSPIALLGSCLGIEAAMGRIRSFKNGPRIIDLDLLEYEGFKSDTEELTVPHKRMMEREFVLKPLCDISDNIKYHEALEKLLK